MLNRSWKAFLEIKLIDAIYIAKNDEFTHASQLSKMIDDDYDSDRLPFSSAHDYLSRYGERRLPVDAIVELTKNDNKMERLAIDPPYNLILRNGDSSNHPDVEYAVKHIEDFFKRKAFTVEAVAREDMIFPPGHPMSGVLYKLHPLAAYVPEKRNLYIPASTFEATVFAERESELIGILVDLGATKIKIGKSSSNQFSHEEDATIKGSAPNLKVDANFQDASLSGSASFENREFELEGRQWMKDSRLDRGKYGWLSLEPEWESVVKARENGHCRFAEIELFRQSHFHVESESALKIRHHFLKGDAKSGLSRSNSQSDYKIIRVEFSPVQTTYVG